MQNLPAHIDQSIRERKLLRPGDRILVAVSGGLDSMVLLRLLHELAGQSGRKLVVAHYNHQLRGRASEADERFVRATAKRLKLPIRVGRGDVKALAGRAGLSIEMAARQLRHRFLAQAARRANCRIVALAHQADDQVELFFLRLLRGAGGEGLAGMKWESVSPADDGVRLIRPLLDVTKETLARFAREQGIRFREDASNDSRDILRNRVRHELLPWLRRRFQPALDRTILRLMDVTAAEAEVVNEAAQKLFNAGAQAGRLMDWPVGLQRRVIQFQLQRLRVEANFDLIETLRCSPGKVVTVAAGLHLVCDEGGRISRAAAGGGNFRLQRRTLLLRGDAGEFTFGGTAIEWRRIERAGNRRVAVTAGQEVFDANRVGARMVLRHWRPGDRFQPIGMAVAVKLQDWFTNRKIPPARRRELLVATTARGEIFWVEGQRIGERFKLTPETRRRLLWYWRAVQTT